MNEILCFDLETGGFNPYKCGICSITLKVVGKDIIETIYIKPHPKRLYTSKALEVNGLSLEKLEEIGVTEKEAIFKVRQFIVANFITKPVMLAHNIVFDSQFMNALFARYDIESSFTGLCYYHPLDTMIIMKTLKDAGMVNINRVNLASCYRYFFNEDFADAHTSEADVIATEKIYRQIQQLLMSKK